MVCVSMAGLVDVQVHKYIAEVLIDSWIWYSMSEEFGGMERRADIFKTERNFHVWSCWNLCLFLILICLRVPLPWSAVMYLRVVFLHLLRRVTA